MERFFRKRFGTAETVAVVVGILVMVFLDHCVFNYANGTAKEILNYVKILWLIIMAVIFGSYTGVIIGVAGTILTQYFAPQLYWFVSAFALGIYGYIIGSYSDKYEIRTGFFRLKQAMFLEFVMLFANILVFIFMNPLVKFITAKSVLLDEMRSGVSYAPYLSVCTILFVCPICYVVNLIHRKIIKK